MTEECRSVGDDDDDGDESRFEKSKEESLQRERLHLKARRGPCGGNGARRQHNNQEHNIDVLLERFDVCVTGSELTSNLNAFPEFRMGTQNDQTKEAERLGGRIVESDNPSSDDELFDSDG